MHETADTIGWAKPEDVGLSRERLARIGDLLERDVEDGKLPGAVALVARRGRIVHFKAYGRRAPEAAEAMSLDAIFRIYSMTKPLVSVAALTLLEEGRIALDDPVSAYVPAFSEVEVGHAGPGGLERRKASRPITLQDLFRHTSGLTYEWLETGPVGQLYARAKAGWRGQTNEGQAEILAGLPLLHEPGARWSYGRSTDLLGRVVEVVTGQSLGEALSSRLLQPLGMFETAFHVPPEHQARIAEPFARDPDTGEPVTLLDVREKPAMENGGGGLVSTAPDYARFLHMLASGGSLESARILGPATIAYMLADHLGPEVAIGPELLDPGYGFGLGFAIRRQDGIAPFPGTRGDAFWLGLGGTSFWYDPARDLYAIFMAQAPGRRRHYIRMMRQLVYAALTD